MPSPSSCTRMRASPPDTASVDSPVYSCGAARCRGGSRAPAAVVLRRPSPELRCPDGLSRPMPDCSNCGAAAEAAALDDPPEVAGLQLDTERVLRSECRLAKVSGQSSKAGDLIAHRREGRRLHRKYFVLDPIDIGLERGQRACEAHAPGRSAVGVGSSRCRRAGSPCPRTPQSGARFRWRSRRRARPRRSCQTRAVSAASASSSTGCATRRTMNHDAIPAADSDTMVDKRRARANDVAKASSAWCCTNGSVSPVWAR